MTPNQQRLREKYTQALGNQNVRQLLNGIGHTESGNRYNIRYSGERGGAKIDTSAPGDHPNILASRKDGRKSSAAGRYMFTNPTWRDAKKALGLDNFNDPKQQDLAAAWLLDQVKEGGKSGLQHAMAGDMVNASRAAGQSRGWEAVAKIGPEKFANNLASYRSVPLGEMNRGGTGTALSGTEPTAVAATTPEPPADTRRLGRIGTVREGEGTSYGPERPGGGDFMYVSSQNPQAGADSFQAAMQRAHASVDQRLIPGTPESYTVNPLRRMMHDLGWKMGPAPGSGAPLGIDPALAKGVSPQDWEKNMREFFGASKTSPIMDEFMKQQALPQQAAAPVRDANISPVNSGMTQFQQQMGGAETFPVVPPGQTWQQTLNPLSDARKEANDLMFGDQAQANMPNWPAGLNDAINSATEENWNRG